MTIVVLRYAEGVNESKDAAEVAAKSLPSGVVSIVVPNSVSVETHMAGGVGSYAVDLAPAELKPFDAHPMAEAFVEALRKMGIALPVMTPVIAKAE